MYQFGIFINKECSILAIEHMYQSKNGVHTDSGAWWLSVSYDQAIYIYIKFAAKIYK